jgi:gamma-glutamylcyclotransferase (GGCT)/AIG2-like uncharacterized protein YtfP
MFYFAYGSNLNFDQMRARCSSAKFLCIARLPSHRLAFSRKSIKRQCGVADVIPQTGSVVWGAVYEIQKSDLAQLNSDEGVNSGAYVRIDDQVVLDQGGKAIKVAIYIANKQPNPPLPNAQYKNLIVSGARHWKLPEEYILKLEQIEIE